MGTISLPGWESIISIPHGPKPTVEQVKEYYQAKRQHRPPNLSQDVTAEIERRKDIRDRIQSSATPETAKNWTNVLTWLDDAQDLFSLVAFGGRIAGKLMPRILGRLIPGLGWILLGSDILKLLTLLATLLQPFFVAMCHGLKTGIFGALPPLVMGNAAKLIGHGLTGLNPFSRAARLARAAKFTGKLFRFGEALEMAQALKTLTGYGLTLGGIMGTITESAYALELAARGQPVSIAVPGGARLSLHQGDLTAYAPGSPKGLSNLYRKMADQMSRPADKAQALSNADVLERIGQ